MGGAGRDELGDRLWVGAGMGGRTSPGLEERVVSA